MNTDIEEPQQFINKGEKTIKQMQFSPYLIPIGTKFRLGKREWILIHRDTQHPDHMTFDECSPSPDTTMPKRVMFPSEVQALFDLGVTFNAPLNKETAL